MSSQPTTLGQYQIIREIARSNDIVYEAYDSLMNRRVAIKELAMPGGSTPQQQEDRVNRFKREAQAAGTLNHPNIMTVFSFAEDQGRTFMAMEYLDGGTLRAEIDSRGALGLERSVEIASAVLDGLEHSHSKGVVHRDIKPDNIQILSNGTVKITDFGIARLTFQPNLTMDGQVFGTPSYMSPEQVVGKDIDARSDIFSVGVVLYEMLAGQKPFIGDSVVSITYAIMNKDPVQPTNIPWAMWEVVRKALDKTPAMRYASAADMKRALTEALRPAAPDPVAQPSLYNYGAPAPAFSPAPPPAPVQYPFDPYTGQPSAGTPSAGPGYTQAPYGGGSMVPPPFPGQAYSNQPYGQMPAPGPLPIYYPPPPRQPLLKADTVIFLKKLGVAVLIMGTLFLLLVVALQAAVDRLSASKLEEADRHVLPSSVAANESAPVEDRIRELQQYRDRLHSPDRIQATNRDLAALYNKLGEKTESEDDKKAEHYFQTGMTLDPHNPAFADRLAQLYSSKAGTESDAANRAELWKHAGEQWKQAADDSTEAAAREKYKTQAAQMFYYFAYELKQIGNSDRRQEARSALYLAQENAETGSDLQRQIRELLADMS